MGLFVARVGATTVGGSLVRPRYGLLIGVFMKLCRTSNGSTNNPIDVRATKAAFSSSSPGWTAGPPISSQCPVGECQFGPDPISVPLLSRTPVSPTSSILRFGLPDSTQPLKLATCGCLVAHATLPNRASEKEEEKETSTPVRRAYTPISTNRDIGYFDLLVKNYGELGRMSRHLHDIEPGRDCVEFSHGDKNVKIQAPFPAKRILMLAGGTGITPMIQALHDILGRRITTDEQEDDDNDDDFIKVTLLYGSRVQDDILGRELLDSWAALYPDQLRVIHVLSHEPPHSNYQGLRGFLTKELIAQEISLWGHENTKLLIFVCGPPPFYEVLSGPRLNTAIVSGILGELGFTPEQVYKF